MFDEVTRRDQIAMAAMAVLIDCTQWQFGKANKNHSEIDADDLAREAYDIADAMERARSRKVRRG